MHWFFTVLLIAASAGILVLTGVLLRWLFTTAPAAAAADPNAERPEEPAA